MIVDASIQIKITSFKMQSLYVAFCVVLCRNFRMNNVFVCNIIHIFCLENNMQLIFLLNIRFISVSNGNEKENSKISFIFLNMKLRWLFVVKTDRETRI